MFIQSIILLFHKNDFLKVTRKKKKKKLEGKKKPSFAFLNQSANTFKTEIIES